MLKESIPYIALALTVIGFIFRNQLSSIGDKISKDWKSFAVVLSILVCVFFQFVIPCKQLLHFYNHYQPTNDYVFAVALNTSMIFYFIIFDIVTYVWIKVREQKSFAKNLDSNLTNYITIVNLTKELDEVKNQPDELRKTLEIGKKIEDLRNKIHMK
jgi:hypothetical protein